MKTLIFLTVMTPALLAGCSGGGKLSIHSEDVTGLVIKTGFEKGLYRLESQGNVTMLLYDGLLDRPAQAMTIRLLWQPKNARTPFDADATNATIRHAVFTDDLSGKIGIYNGAGYVYLRGKVGGRYLKASVWHANLRLTDAGEGFVSTLGKASLSGNFAVIRNDQAVQQALHQLSVLATNRLGYPQYVRAYSHQRE